MKPCKYCDAPVNEHIHEDEMGMCVDCSDAYYQLGHYHDCSSLCLSLFDGKTR